MNKNIKVAIYKIEDALRNGQTTLSLKNMSLEEVPDEITKLFNLKRLDLSGNNLQKLPNFISDFKYLSEINVRNNRLITLPPELGKSGSITKLFCGNNKLSSLPAGLKKSNRLSVLEFSNNLIKELPAWFFYFPFLKKIKFDLYNSYLDLFDDFTSENHIICGENPIESPPIEIIEQGRKAIDNYFDEVKDLYQYLYEAKLVIIGEPGAGKTSLAVKFIDEKNPLPKPEATTKGIDIFQTSFISHSNKKFKVHIWDFGGQEIYKTTHQFFLTKRSLYTLVSDNRNENTDFNYWLQSIEILTNNSPLIIVQNEKQGRKRELNEGAMKSQFSNLQKIMQTNLHDNTGLQGLREEIKHQIYNLPHIGTKLPKTWIEIRGLLENISLDANYINYEDYIKLCLENGISSKDKADFLSEYLHDLGIFLHFRDSPILRRIIILKPSWATDAVYMVLDNNDIIENKGVFEESALGIIWNKDDYKEMTFELLELMLKFELCYKISNKNKYIVPQLLAIKSPDYEWQSQDNIQLRYVYSFMPKGIMTRFIVKMHRFIINDKLVWKEGVILSRENAKGEIVEIYGKDEIHIRVEGEGKNELLILILDCLDEINETFGRIKVEKLIPCTCSVCRKHAEPHYFIYSNLLRRKAKGINFIECDISYSKINVWQLIGEIFPRPFTKEELIRNVSKNEWEELFERLKKVAQETIYERDIIIFESNYNSIQGQYRVGIINEKNKNLELNKIRQGVLDILNQIF